MRFLKRLAQRELRLGWIEAFSDGVFAIVGVISYLLGVAATFFNVHLAFVLYALTPLFFITPPQPRT